jgi:N-acetylmuramoyl-L-alanine amidase
VGPTPTPIPIETLAAPTLEPESTVPRVGIVAGHWGHDTGAVCDDGLQEVAVNLAVAVKVVKILEGLGYEVDLLEEFDVRLHGYSADALISIHADSCEPFPDANPPLSGFKVASVEDSWVPEAERELVDCLVDHYAQRTGMFYHADTVTFDMRHYHTFYEVDGFTPAAIIETGFMYADRHIVAGQPELVAQAIAEGIVCFLAPEE